MKTETNSSSLYVVLTQITLLNVMKMMLKNTEVPQWTQKWWGQNIHRPDTMKRQWPERAGCVRWLCYESVLTSSLRLLTSSTPPGPECPDNATLPAAAAAAAAALRGLMAPTTWERKGEGKNHVSHIAQKSRQLSISAETALWPCSLPVCTQAHPSQTPHTSGKPTFQSRYLPLGGSLSGWISHRLALRSHIPKQNRFSGLFRSLKSAAQ